MFCGALPTLMVTLFELVAASKPGDAALLARTSQEPMALPVTTPSSVSSAQAVAPETSA